MSHRALLFIDRTFSMNKTPYTRRYFYSLGFFSKAWINRTVDWLIDSYSFSDNTYFVFFPERFGHLMLRIICSRPFLLHSVIRSTRSSTGKDERCLFTARDDLSLFFQFPFVVYRPIFFPFITNLMKIIIEENYQHLIMNYSRVNSVSLLCCVHRCVFSSSTVLSHRSSQLQSSIRSSRISAPSTKKISNVRYRTNHPRKPSTNPIDEPVLVEEKVKPRNMFFGDDRTEIRIFLADWIGSTKAESVERKEKEGKNW